MRPLIAIVGRPNVGKSTLFNKLVGKPLALVEDVPGVTRDRHYADGDWDGRALSFVDTGGFVPTGADGALEPKRPGDAAKTPLGGGVGGKLPTLLEDKQLLASMRAQAQLAVEEASAIIFVADAHEGLVAGDQEVVQLLRRSGKPLFAVANKVDSEKGERELPIADFYRLGTGRVYPISAEHSRGLSDLMDDVVAALPSAPKMNEEPEWTDDGKIRLAVVGRPNVGKSTLLNAIVGKDRFIASPVPGTTHDAVDEEFDYKGRRFILTDTAGIRRQKLIGARVEAFSVVRALRALESCDVAVLLLDPTEPGVDQDARIAGIVAEKGRALIVAVNKWDLIEADEKKAKDTRELIQDKLHFVDWAPIIFVSAKNNLRVTKVLDLAISLQRQATSRIPTPELNDFVQDVQNSQPAPLWRGLPVKFFFAAQVAIRPPTIAIHTNRPQAIIDSYRRFMLNKLRETFKLEVPVRLLFKQKSGNRRPTQATKEREK